MKHPPEEDIIEIKPGLGPFHVNVRALLRRLFRKPTIDPVGIVARRFIQIFEDHGVDRTQIPRLLPQVTLDKLADPDLLLAALTTAVLDQTANLLGIRREWLDGVGRQIYDRHWTYKRPETFFEDIASLDFANTTWPIRVFVQDSRLSYRSRRTQPLVLVLAHKIATLGENEIERYTIYGDGWDWGYRKCRIQIKAMLRIACERYAAIVPIYKVSLKILHEIETGCRVPRQYFRRRLPDPSLEDFALSPDESRVSKEADELPEVLGYIKAFGLRELVGLPEDPTVSGNTWRREMFL